MTRFAVLLPALAVAACHQAPSVTADNASANEVAAKVAAAGGGPAKLAPGRYEMTTRITKVEIPGMPAAEKGMMDSMGKGATSTTCVTPEQADKPAASMFGGGSKDCTYDHFAMSAGTIDATMTCKSGATVMTSTMKGSFASDGFHMDMTTDGKGAGPMGSMTMAATIDAKRTGACTGTEGRAGG